MKLGCSSSHLIALGSRCLDKQSVQTCTRLHSRCDPASGVRFPCAVFVFRRDMGLFGPSFSGASLLSSGAAVPPARRPPSSFASSVSSPALASSVPEQLVTNSNAKSRKDSALQFCPVQFRHTRTLQIVKSTWLAAKWQRANAGQSP